MALQDDEVYALTDKGNATQMSVSGDKIVN